MSFIFTNFVVAFIDVMNKVFKQYLKNFVIFFIDNILIVSSIVGVRRIM